MSIKNWNINKALPWILVIAGIVGYASAFVIMFDKIKILENPHYIPSCDLNPIISCGDVMHSKQADVFGFPNPLIGLGAFPALGTIGIAILAGERFKRWFWLMVNAGLALALIFVHWLFFETVYRIQALCPYCILVWIATITSFWYVTLFNLDHRNIKLPAALERPQRFVRRHHIDILVIWFVVIAALILKHFWYYYGRNFKL